MTMSGSTKLTGLEGQLGSAKLYNKTKLEQFETERPPESTSAFASATETVGQSPLLRQDTYYVESTLRADSGTPVSAFEHLDTIDYEDPEYEDVAADALTYRPRTLLEAVDTMMSILDDLGNRYNRWKYGSNGIYRFYCHKYNMKNVEASRPYYTKILNQLNVIDNISLHLLSSHYQKKSDSAVYSSSDVVDKVLCQLDELVSCYCSMKCAMGIYKSESHVCPDVTLNHTSLKWKNTSTDRFLTVTRSVSLDRNSMLDRNKVVERNPSLEWSRPAARSTSMDSALLNRNMSTETLPDLEILSDRPRLDEAMERVESGMRDTFQKLSESCFTSEVPEYQRSVMEFFSERGIMHNFSYPYRDDQRTCYIHPFLRAAVCHNCGRFVRCRCQRKIFRASNHTPQYTDMNRYFQHHDPLAAHTNDIVEAIERNSSEYVNEVYERFHANAKSPPSTPDAPFDSGLKSSELNSMYSHRICSSLGRLQFVTANMETTGGCMHEEPQPAVPNKRGPVKGESDLTSINAMSGKRVDSMGSIYYANLFKGTPCKVAVQDIFSVVNTTPFSMVSEDILNAHKKVPWYDAFASVWWRMDRRFEDSRFFDEEGNLEAYILNVLDALGYLGNLRYDSSLKVIGVGYFRKRHCYWRYFYVTDLWESFRRAVEYFILISALPPEVYIDHKLAAFVVNREGSQRKFPLNPSFLRAYNLLVAFLCSDLKTKKPLDMDRAKVEKHDFGVDVFDQSRLGTYKCTVADVIGVSLKRKLVSMRDGAAPRKHYTQKPATVTPTIKVKLDPQLIYQGIFISTPSSSSATLFNGSGHSGLSATGSNYSISPSRGHTPAPAPSDFNIAQYSTTIAASNFNSTNGSGVLGVPSGPRDASCKGVTSLENCINLRLNNLNIIFSYYPEVCAQYTVVLRQANDLRLQISLLLSDLKCILVNTLQHTRSFSPTNRQNDSDFIGDYVNQPVEDSPVKKGSFALEGTLKNVLSAEKSDEKRLPEKPLVKKPELDKMPVYDVSYNANSNSWTCVLDANPCLLCPDECEKGRNCIYYTHGKRLIELIAKRIKPSELSYTFHPHFHPDNHQSTPGKKNEVCVISFHVAQFGHERARLLATQFKAAYRIQALNTMLIPSSTDGKLVGSEKSKKMHELSKRVESELLHNAITSQLTNMISIHSYIVDSSASGASEQGASDVGCAGAEGKGGPKGDSQNQANPDPKVSENGVAQVLSNASDSLDAQDPEAKDTGSLPKLKKVKHSDQLDEIIKNKLDELDKMGELDLIEDVLKPSNLEAAKLKLRKLLPEKLTKLLPEVLSSKLSPTRVSSEESKLSQTKGEPEAAEVASADTLHFDDCLCSAHGNMLRNSTGPVRLCDVVTFNENLFSFSNIFEIGRLVEVNSRRIKFCPRHCSFIVSWLDAMDQTRIMFYPVERFINAKSFNSLVSKFKAEWPEAVRLHNLHAHSRDASEGAKMFAQASRSLCECFSHLLSLQKIINESIVASLALAVRAISDGSQEKALLGRLFLINEHLKRSRDTVRNSMLLSNEILFPFGALHDEATPPLSDDEPLDAL